MKIYTKTGDTGQSALLGGERRAKSDARFVAMGTVDELNAALGVVVSSGAPTELEMPLRQIQHQLFELGMELATAQAPGSALAAISPATVEGLERQIDAYEATLTPLREFILPGGCGAAAGLHLARAICRRGERVLVSLARDEPLRDVLLAYMNRLGDLLFVMARVANRASGQPEIPWQKSTRVAE